METPKRFNDLTKSVPSEQQLDRDANSQARRGSFIEVVATWEKYIQDILEETVETVFECITRNDSAQMALVHPNARELMRKAVVHHVVIGKHGQKSKKKFVNLTRHEANAVDQIMSVDIFVQPDLWKTLLNTYKQSLLSRCGHVYPLFSRQDGIDSKFISIFETTSCLSEIIVEMGPIKYAFFNKEKRKNEPIGLATSQSVNDVLRLYYGARCAFAHGKNDTTFQPGGALHDFPAQEVFQERIGKAPGDLLYIIYKYARDYGKIAWVYYYNLVNLQRFFLSLAFRLFGAISKWVYDEFGACIWNFDPDKFEPQAEIEQETF